MFPADLLPTEHHVGAAYNMAYDVEPYISTVTRRWFLEAAAAERLAAGAGSRAGQPVPACEGGWEGMVQAARKMRESTKRCQNPERQQTAGAATAPSPRCGLTEQIAVQEDVLRQGGGPAGRERQRNLGRLTARQRLQKLLDPGAPLHRDRALGWL